jgi:hypothetical protein
VHLHLQIPYSQPFCVKAAATAAKIVQEELEKHNVISIYSFQFSSSNLPESARNEGIDCLRRAVSPIVKPDGKPVGAGAGWQAGAKVHTVMTTPWLGISCAAEDYVTDVIESQANPRVIIVNRARNKGSYGTPPFGTGLLVVPHGADGNRH